MIALAVSALIAAYLLVPNALFRFVLGRIVPLRAFQEGKTEDLTRAVVTLALVYAFALAAVWYLPGCKNHPFPFSDERTLRASDYKVVAGALYSETLFRDHGAGFWDALARTVERQGRFLCWYYVLVLGFATLSGWAIRRYGGFRRNPVYSWIAEFYLLPHVSQWYVLLTPFTFADKRTAVKADVLMTDNTLYRGDVANHFIDKDGNLSGIFLSNPQRFDRRAYLREQDKWGRTRSLSTSGNQFQAQSSI